MGVARFHVGARNGLGVMETPEISSTALRLLLVSSTGGHLAQLLAMRPWWRQHRRVWVTHDKADAVSLLSDEKVIWAHHPTTRNIPNLMRNLGLAIRVIRRTRPDVVVSTGAGVAVPFFVAARLFRVATCFIETYDRIDSRSMTARLVRPFTDMLLLQWEEQRELYPEGIVVGPLL